MVNVLLAWSRRLGFGEIWISAGVQECLHKLVSPRVAGTLEKRHVADDRFAQGLRADILEAVLEEGEVVRPQKLEVEMYISVSDFPRARVFREQSLPRRGLLGFFE